VHLKVDFSLSLTGQTWTRKRKKREKEKQSDRAKGEKKTQPKQEKVAPGLPLERAAKLLISLLVEMRSSNGTLMDFL